MRVASISACNSNKHIFPKCPTIPFKKKKSALPLKSCWSPVNFKSQISYPHGASCSVDTQCCHFCSQCAKGNKAIYKVKLHSAWFCNPCSIGFLHLLSCLNSSLERTVSCLDDLPHCNHIAAEESHDYHSSRRVTAEYRPPSWGHRGSHLFRLHL